MKTGKISIIISSTIIAIVGAVLFIWPSWTLSTLCLIVGTAFIVAAITGAVFSFLEKDSMPFRILYTIGAIICFILGLIFINSQSFIISLIPIIVGVGLLVNGVLNLIQAVSIRRNGGKGALHLILAILTIGFGVLIFANPFSTMEIFIKAIGIMLIYDGISNIITGVSLR